MAGGLFGSIASALGVSAGVDNTSVNTSGTQTVQRQFDQKAIDKTIYDIMSSDQGLASLANAENASGGYKSSSKTLLAQDLIAKVAGTIAQITAPEVTTTTKSTDAKNTKVGTVICTYLAEQGYLNLPLYLRGHFHYLSLPDNTLRGYQFWAIAVVNAMKKHPRLCRIITPIVQSRYEYIVDRKFRVMGALTVWIGEPVCYVIGVFLPQGEIYGRSIA